MIGILTETIGNPTPMRFRSCRSGSCRAATCPFPIAPQDWHFRQSIDYSVTANCAVLDYRVAQPRERSSSTSIGWARTRSSAAAGTRWTTTPRRRREQVPAAPCGGGGRAGGTRRGAAARRPRAGSSSQLLRDPAMRDPRGYIMPADQADFPTATKFVNALHQGRHHGASRDRAVSAVARQELSGRLVRREDGAGVPAARARHVRAAGSSRRLPYPGGPPTPPYDNAGWTLAFQMGVEFDRILDGFDGPFEKVNGLQTPPAGQGDGARQRPLVSEPRDERRVHRRQPAARRRARVSWLQRQACTARSTSRASTAR